MTVIDSIILGIVEGLTEYLPVSSTGHLIVTEYLLGVDNPANKAALDAFSVCIQGGAILAVLLLYFGRVKGMLEGFAGKNPAGLRLGCNLLLAFVPAVGIGLAFDDEIKEYLFGVWPVVWAWVVGGLVILLYVRWRNSTGQGNAGKGLDEMSYGQALLVGFMQCIAMWPGTSRSLMTMLGGMVAGLSVAAAVEFSFLLGLVTLGAATAYDAMKHGALMVETFGLWPLAMGSLMAFVSAMIAVKWMVGYLQKHSLSIFGWYRIAAGCVLAALVFTGMGQSHDAGDKTPGKVPAGKAAPVAPQAPASPLTVDAVPAPVPAMVPSPAPVVP